MLKYRPEYISCSLKASAAYQRQPKAEVMVHRGQASQYGNADYLSFMKGHCSGQLILATVLESWYLTSDSFAEFFKLVVASS